MLDWHPAFLLITSILSEHKGTAPRVSPGQTDTTFIQRTTEPHGERLPDSQEGPNNYEFVRERFTKFMKFLLDIKPRVTQK